MQLFLLVCSALCFGADIILSRIFGKHLHEMRSLGVSEESVMRLQASQAQITDKLSILGAIWGAAFCVLVGIQGFHIVPEWVWGFFAAFAECYRTKCWM